MTGEPEFRPIGENDLETLNALAEAFHKEDDHALDHAGRRALKKLCEGDPMAFGWFIMVDGTVSGYMVLTLGFSIEYGGRDGFLDDLYLVPEARGRGVGKAAMTFLEHKARTRGVMALHLETGKENEAALGLYRKRGFRSSGRELMTKRLK